MPKQPNILFIMTDQMTGRALSHENQCQTPNLDVLASEGVRFQRAYTVNAICSPSRASLMTGTYPSTHGIWDCTHTQRREWVDLPQAEPLTHFSRRLADAGYRNGYFGKWHVEQSQELERYGWHEVDIDIAGVGGEVIPGSEVHISTPGYRDFLASATFTDESTASHPAFDAGIDFIERTASQAEGNPFCCFISTIEPHDPYIPPQRFLDLYDVEQIDLSPTLRTELEQKPEVLQRMRSVWANLSENDWRTITAAYWASISFIDDQVGRVLTKVSELGLADDTIIVFTSDHGDMLGGHGLLTKGVATSYEEVYNIPLVVRVPGIRNGQLEERALVSLVDLGPTLLDLCGLQPLEQAQGRSFAPVLAGGAVPSEWRSAYAEFYGQRFVYTQRIVWAKDDDGDWKFVFSPGGVDELYNLATDPNESNNLISDPRYSQQRDSMVKQMWSKMAEIGDESLFGSHYATLRTAPFGPLHQ